MAETKAGEKARFRGADAQTQKNAEALDQGSRAEVILGGPLPARMEAHAFSESWKAAGARSCPASLSNILGHRSQSQIHAGRGLGGRR